MTHGPLGRSAFRLFAQGRGSFQNFREHLLERIGSCAILRRLSREQRLLQIDERLERAWRKVHIV